CFPWKLDGGCENTLWPVTSRLLPAPPRAAPPAPAPRPLRRAATPPARTPGGVRHRESHDVPPVSPLAAVRIPLLEPARDPCTERDLGDYRIVRSQQLRRRLDWLEQHLGTEVLLEQARVEDPVRPEAPATRWTAVRDGGGGWCRGGGQAPR